MSSDAPAAPPADRGEVRAWQLYDFANSAFFTTVVAALAGPYLTAVAQDAVGDHGTVLRLGALHVPADALFAYVTSASVVVQVVLLPLLGAVADSRAAKKRLLALWTVVGATATTLLLTVGEGDYWWGSLLFLVANVAAGAAITVYNAFLPEIAPAQDHDRVSSGGFALGYLGGGLLLAADLGLVLAHDSLGIGKALAVRLSLASAGVWWGAFGLLAVRRLRTRAVARDPAGAGAAALGVRGVRAAIADLRRLPLTARFLAAFLLYNDAVQAVIGLASVYLTQELYVARGRPSDDATSFLLALVLLIQVVAIGGSLGFERLARRIGAKRTIEVTLVVWIGVVVYAFAALHSQAQAVGMGVVIALVLGGSQALSRSLYASLLPAGSEAAFFGFYEVSERGTAWIATALFGTVVTLTGSYRWAILSLVVLFVAGLALLVSTDTDAASRAAMRSRRAVVAE